MSGQTGRIARADQARIPDPLMTGERHVRLTLSPPLLLLSSGQPVTRCPASLLSGDLRLAIKRLSSINNQRCNTHSHTNERKQGDLRRMWSEPFIADHSLPAKHLDV